MDRDIARIVERRVLATLAPLEKELGVKITMKGGTIGHTFLQLKIELAEVGKNGQAETREAQAFKQMAKYYGLSPAMLGGKFRGAGDVFTVTGLKPKSRKWPILGVNSRGKTYKFQPAQVKTGWVGELPADCPKTGFVPTYDDEAEIERRIAEVEGRD